MGLDRAAADRVDPNSGKARNFDLPSTVGAVANDHRQDDRTWVCSVVRLIGVTGIRALARRDAIIKTLIGRSRLFSWFSVDPLIYRERPLVAVGNIRAQVATAGTSQRERASSYQGRPFDN